MSKIVNGTGCYSVAVSLYETHILRECDRMRTEGVYVCLANIQSRMASYNQETLSNVFWHLARNGALQVE